MNLARHIIPALLAVSACHAAPDPRAPTPTPTSDVFVERAIDADEAFAAQPPTLAAATEHALHLARLSRAATKAPVGERRPDGPAHLAAVADQLRNELLACRTPRWKPRLPRLDRSVATAAWLTAHRRELRAGLADGWTASRVEIDHVVERIDTILAEVHQRDDELYVAPPLRDHRAFLVEELRNHARDEPGLAGLPSARACRDAMSARMISAAWTPDATRRSASRLLTEPHVVDEEALASLSSGAGELDGWRPNHSVVHGWRLHVSTTRNRRADGILAAVALGALIDLELHDVGSGIAGARQQMSAHPWVPPSVADTLLATSVERPLHWASQLAGHELVHRLARDAAERGVDPARLGKMVEAIGGLPPEIFEQRLRERLALR